MYRMMVRVVFISLMGLSPGLAQDAWTTADWPEYLEFVESLKTRTDAELANLNSSPAVIYGFLLAAGEVLDALALSEDYADYPLAARRHAHRCAYRYLSDRLSYNNAPGSPADDWPYGGVVVVAQTAFDQCVVNNIENEDADDARRTRYLPYVPPDRPGDGTAD